MKEMKIISTKIDSGYKFVKPVVVQYRKGGVNREWEYTKRDDSVACLIYEEDTDKLVMVKQCRIPVLLECGDKFTLEFCAGLVDSGESVRATMVQEIFEECGYEVEELDLEFICSFYKDAGSTASKQTLYFCSVQSHQKVGKGGGSANEDIEIVKLSRKDAKSLLSCDSENTALLSAGTILGLNWFFK